MFTSTFIKDYFTKRQRPDFRWLFEPVGLSPVDGHRYSLIFLPPERRFVLGRMKIEPFVQVNDDELVAQFSKALDPEEIAACMAQALEPDPDDTIPF